MAGREKKKSKRTAGVGMAIRKIESGYVPCSRISTLVMGEAPKTMWCLMTVVVWGWRAMGY
jgi:hypothetical protein